MHQQGRVVGAHHGVFVLAKHPLHIVHHLLLYVVGIEDPAQEDVRRGLKAQLRETLGDAAEAIPTFFLRGAIRWRSLGVLEQVKMRGWMKAIREKAQRTQTEDMLLEAEGGAIDFSDEADLAPIVHAARFGAEGEA